MFRAALQGWPPIRLVLNGVDDASLAAARQATAIVRLRQTRNAPFVQLDRDFLSHRSANTREQLRRSDRAYGTVSVRRAADVSEALAYVDELAALHQARWQARGQPGAFASPFFGRFHRALIERGLPRHEIDLLRITADGGLVGLLYNFRFRGHVLAYQGGFDYAGADGARKPGLTCHHAAIREAAASGAQRYDLLAGDDRYKRSLSDGVVRLHWLEAGSRLDLTLGARRLVDAALQSGRRDGGRAPAMPRAAAG
jgi:CelD/BcsL family acetyltransferase involved in cellulose biosynthesis